MIIRFVTEVGLVSEVVTDIKIVAKAYHALVVLVDVPIVLREDDFTNLGFRILQDWHKTPSLDEAGAINSGELEAGCAQVDHADQALGSRGFLDELGVVDHPRGLDPAVVHP